MNFVAIIGVDEECVSGDIDLTVEFKNMNALNKTFIKATNTFIGVAVSEELLRNLQLDFFC